MVEYTNGLMFGCQDPQQHAVDMLLAEIDVYEMFYFKHCQGRKVQLALCEGTVFCLPLDLFVLESECAVHSALC